MLNELTVLDEVEMRDWTPIKLGNVVRIVTDGISAADLATLPEVYHYSLPAFDAGEGPDICPGEAIKSNKTIVPDDCILFSKLNPRIPRIWRVKGSVRPHSYCSTEFWPLVGRSKGIDLDFLTHYLSSFAFLGHPDITPSSSTNSHQRIDRKAFEKFEFLLPPLGEQRRIAEVLEAMDEAMAANNALLSGIKATKQGAMEAALSGGFSEVRLETLLADTRYPMRSGPFGSALLKSELQPQGIPLLGIDNVHAERFAQVYRRFISDEKYRELSRYTVYPDDVMVTIMGTVGRCCVVPRDIGTAISSKHVWTLTLDKTRYSPALLAWQINHSPTVLTQLHGSAQGGIMSAISSSTLRDLVVPLPSPAEVQEIENLLLSFNAQIAALEVELATTRNLKTALMTDLLSGRVRVPA